MADILQREMNLPKNIPKDLSDLLEVMVTDFSAILRENFVGIYLWGSLTDEAFDEACSDVDCIGVTRRDLDEREFSELDDWFKNKGEPNRWVQRIDMRFVIDQEFLDKGSRCGGFYHYTGRLVRHGSDGNPIIWMNIGSSGITLWGKDAKLIAPQVSDQCLNDWAIETVSPIWRATIHGARENRPKNRGRDLDGSRQATPFRGDGISRMKNAASRLL